MGRAAGQSEDVAHSVQRPLKQMDATAVVELGAGQSEGPPHVMLEPVGPVGMGPQLVEPHQPGGIPEM